jgi:hypothetical protein
LNDHSHHKAQYDYGCNRKIKKKIFALYPDVAGKSSYPVQFIVKEINNHSDQNDQGADENDIFTGIATHA